MMVIIMKRDSFARSRRFKYGGTAILLTVCFIAVVIIVNVIFTALANKFSLYIDMTSEGIYTISDAAKELLEDVDQEVKIIFCEDPDYIDSYSVETRLMRSAAERFEKEFDFIKVEYINSVKEPHLVSKYITTKAGGITTGINPTSIILESGTEFRVYAPQAFFTYAEEDRSLFADNSERKLVSGILSVTAAEYPIAYLTRGHGESIEPSNPLYITLADAGFDVRTIDLSSEEIDENTRLIIINDPKYDFLSGGDKMSEIEKIDRYLAKYGTLMVFKDPNTQKLPNLEEFLYEWGIVFEDTVVKDTNRSISIDGYSIVAEYVKDTLGGSIFTDISKLASPPKTIFERVSPISIAPIYTQAKDEQGNPLGAYTYYGNNANRDLSAMLISSPTSVATRNNEVVDEKGSYNLMVICRDTRMIENESYSSYVIAAGTSNFTASKYLISNVYANEEILYATLRATGREKVPADIEFKVFKETKIENMTIAEARRWTVGLVTVLPIASLLVGLYVVVRRRYL